MTVLELDHISHFFFSDQKMHPALSDLSLSVQNGEFVSILGPSGCGKTTLLSIISGLIQPTSGSVWINDQRVLSPSAHVGYMLQQDYLFPWKTVKDNILLGLNIQKKCSQEAIDYCYHLLDQVGLSDMLEHYPKELSGGMRQRVALVRTLATKPTLLLLDEPFSALDYQTKLKLENLVVKLLKQYNKTTILVTHDIGEAIAMSDRIIILKNHPGRIHQIVETPEILKQLSPFEARIHEAYSPFFEKLWKEIDELDKERNLPLP